MDNQHRLNGQYAFADLVDGERLRPLLEAFSQSVGEVTLILRDHPGRHVLLTVNGIDRDLDDPAETECAIPILIRGEQIATLSTPLLSRVAESVVSGADGGTRRSVLAALARILSEWGTATLETKEKTEHLEALVKIRTDDWAAATQALESFSYSVSHDLRAPLRGIDGWSQALVEDYGDRFDAQARDYLARVRTETQRLGHLIDDLLRLSRISASAFNLSTVDLSDRATKMAGQLKAENPDRHLEFVIQAGVRVQGDAALLDIVLNQLFDNAMKFTGRNEQARIEFGTVLRDTTPAYFVRDNGVGFEPAYAQKLFGVFQRMHRASDFPGTGIGLAIVQRIVQRHGGKAWAEAAVDQGATLYFTLPGDH
jgi:signal transduction histidine kinase